MLAPSTTTTESKYTTSSAFRWNLSDSADHIGGDPVPRSHDDYGLLCENASTRPLAPSVEALDAGPLVACGCGGCRDEESDIADWCPKPRVPTVCEARGTVQRLVRGTDQGDHAGLRLDRKMGTYARLLDGDRRLRDEYDDATIALITLRQSPIRPDGGLFTPMTLRDNLSASWESVSKRLRYQLRRKRGFAYEYAKVVAGTETPFATPHMHLLVIVDDPADAVEPMWFDALVDDHVETHGDHVTEKAHEYSPDGNDGAVRVEHDPPLATETSLGYASEGGAFKLPPTRATTYVATQIPRVAIADPIRGEGSAERCAWATATWTFASSKASVSFSHGFPDE